MSAGVIAAHYVAAGGGASYDSVVTALSPISRWKLDDTSGTTAVATAGTAGTYAGTPTLGATGLVTDGGTAVTFDGNTQEVQLPRPTITAAVSIVFFYKGTDGAYFRDQTSTGGTGWLITSNTSVTVRVSGTDHTVVGITAAAINDGNRHMLALTTDGTNVKFYVDGSLIDSWTKTSTGLGSSPLHLGRNGNATGTANFFAGTYDDCSIFASTLASTDISALWAAA